MSQIHPSAHAFGVGLSEELEWLKQSHPDKLHLIHLAERFFKFVAENNDGNVIQGEPPQERGGTYESKRTTGAAMQ